MTAISYVSQREMEAQTGFKKALGYSFPKDDKILIRKNLPKKLEKEVKQHEEEHILKGEEGPGLFSFIGGLFGTSKQAKSADKATAAQTQASQEQIAFARESRDLARGDQAPYQQAGATALEALMSMTGLAQPRSAVGGRGPVRGPRGPRGINAQDYLGGLGGGSGYGNFSGVGRYGARARALPRYGGGHMYGREQGGALYNINELGPESVYQDGAYTRSGDPQTLPPDPTGYVARNYGGAIYGRQGGGFLNGGRQVNWGGPQRMPGGSGYSSIEAPPVTQVPRTQGYAGPGAQAPHGDSPGAQAPGGGYTPPQENPGGVEGGFNFMTDPGYEFRLGEGQRALERGASAAGGLLSGGFGRRMTRYAQDYASNEYSNVYNRISNIAGLGQVAGGQAGQAALSTGAQMGNAAGNAGFGRASGYTAQGNIWGNALNSAGGYLDDVNWGNIFNRNGGGGGGSAPGY